MWSVPVVMTNGHVEDARDVPRVEDEQPIETLSANP